MNNYFLKNNLSNRIVKTAMVAAIYAILTIILAPISYGPIQLRLSEIMVLLAFFNPIYIIGLTIGCLLANIFGGFGILDIVFGTLATFISATSIYLTSKYIKSNKYALILASIWPALFNGVIIGWVIKIASSNPLPLWLLMSQVGIGEFITVTAIGVPLVNMIVKKYGKNLTTA